YTVEVGDTPALNIFLDGDGIDTYLRVYHEGEDEPFAENDDRGDGTVFSALEGLEVEEGDVLIIEAGTYGDFEAGAYSLRVAPPATIEEVGEIALGDSVEGTFPENTRQRYTLTVDETTALHIALEGDDLDTFLRIYVEGEDVPTVQNDDIDADNLSAGWESLVVPGGTTLVIEAGTYSDASAGDYTLTVEEADVTLPPTEAPVEFGDESTTADLCEGAAEIEEPTRLQYFAPEQVLESDVDYGAVFCTEAGNFRIDMYEDEAPITVNSFVFLATNHYFDRSTFHRVIEDFVVQGGDPTGTGFGGPGYEYVNETDNDLTFGGIGVMGMANAGPDTNGSQFFITLAPVARLDGGYTIFGQVLEGIAAVTDIELRDPGTATEPGTQLYTVIIVTIPPEEE
ncbi:MAG TPA: peptidylprolyl isomerase, partial [Oceanobacillus sp.]|nr:peptidylprolyl isomerase [Oceanobacillus sp.]